MKQELHPDYVPAHVRCTCGNEFWTRSTRPELHVEICSNCHPFYTGRQKLVDTGGRVEPSAAGRPVGAAEATRNSGGAGPVLTGHASHDAHARRGPRGPRSDRERGGTGEGAWG